MPDWQIQLPLLVDAYLQYKHGCMESDASNDSLPIKVHTFDVFGKHYLLFHWHSPITVDSSRIS